MRSGILPLCFSNDLSDNDLVKVYEFAQGLIISYYLSSIYSIDIREMFSTTSSGSLLYSYIFSSIYPPLIILIK